MTPQTAVLALPPPIRQPPIESSPHVREFTKLLNDNNSPSRADFMSLIGCVKSMEQQCETMRNELLTMHKFCAEVQHDNQAMFAELRECLASKQNIFQRILEGEMDWRFIQILFPYMEYIRGQVETAVQEGALPSEALDIT